MQYSSRKYLASSLMVLALSVGLSACGESDRRTGDAGPGAGTEDNRMAATDKATPSDSDLENAIKAKIAADEQLKNANLDVDANADKNEVTISGTVGSEDQRSKAVELAKSAQPGVTVNDKIDVKPRDAG